MFQYPAEIKKDSNGTYRVSFPDIPEAHTFGYTRAEALETALSFYIESGQPLPRSSARRGKVMVALT